MILDNFVSQGTLGIQSRNEAKALLIDCVLLRSFLLLPTPWGWWRPATALLLLLLLANFDFLLTEVVEEEDRDLPLQKFKKKTCYVLLHIHKTYVLHIHNFFSTYYISGNLSCNQELYSIIRTHLASLSNEKLELAAPWW